MRVYPALPLYCSWSFTSHLEVTAHTELKYLRQGQRQITEQGRESDRFQTSSDFIVGVVWPTSTNMLLVHVCNWQRPGHWAQRPHLSPPPPPSIEIHTALQKVLRKQSLKIRWRLCDWSSVCSLRRLQVVLPTVESIWAKTLFDRTVCCWTRWLLDQISLLKVISLCVSASYLVEGWHFEMMTTVWRCVQSSEKKHLCGLTHRFEGVYI